jgi:hypothetical protein
VFPPDIRRTPNEEVHRKRPCSGECLSEPTLPTMTIEILPIDKNNGTLPATFGDNVTKELLIAYMRGCTVVMSARTLLPDRFDPNGKKIPLAWYSDGAFAWTAETVAYIERYDFGVPAHFVARVVGQHGVPSVLSDDERRGVVEALREPAAPEHNTPEDDASSPEVFLPAFVDGVLASETAASIVADGGETRSAHPLPDRIRLLEVTHPTGLRMHAVVDTGTPIGPVATWAMYVPPVSLELLCHVASPMKRDSNDPLVAMLRCEPLEATSGMIVSGVVADLDLLLQRTWTSGVMTLRFGFVLTGYLALTEGFRGGSLLDEGVLVSAAAGQPGWWAAFSEGEPTPAQFVDAVVTARSDTAHQDDLMWVDLDTALGNVRAYTDGRFEQLPDIGAQISALLTGVLVSTTDHYDDMENADPLLVDRLARSRWKGPLPGR